jgi:S1-C subfamily serine protease
MVLKPGDRVVELSGQPIATNAEFVSVMHGLKLPPVGATVPAVVFRGANRLSLMLPIEGETKRRDDESYRQDGFPTVFAHDALVKPFECGGPLVDIDGRVVGMTIAVPDLGVCAYALPTSVLREAIQTK